MPQYQGIIRSVTLVHYLAARVDSTFSSQIASQVFNQVFFFSRRGDATVVSKTIIIFMSTVFIELCREYFPNPTFLLYD